MRWTMPGEMIDMDGGPIKEMRRNMCNKVDNVTYPSLNFTTLQKH